MAGNFYGADVAQLRRLARELQAGAQQLDQLGRQLSGTIGTSPWKGRDGDRFRNDWNAAHLKALKAAAAEIGTAARALLLNADEQHAASHSGAGNAGSGLPGAPGHDRTGQELTDRMSGMTRTEQESYLVSEEFRAWMRQDQAHADAAKGVVDQLVDSGLLPATGSDGGPNFYADVLQLYWSESAMRAAGIDPAHWDPSLGVSHNRADIYRVYAFYAELYRNDPRMEWIGMANQVGPTFIAGFEDMAILHDLAETGEDVADFLAEADPRRAAALASIAGLGAADLGYYEASFLSMQKEIFSDIGSQHHAYQQGGMAEIQRLEAAGIVAPRMNEAWTAIDSVPGYSDPQGYHQLTPAQQEALHQASYNMADQEQNYVIADDYDDVRDRTSGVAFTEAMTVLGEPSIEGAKSYYEQFPAVTAYIDTGRFPPVGLDGHHGNISVREDRWELIDRDTLGAYEDWLHGEDNPYGEMTKPMADRVESYRMVPKELRTPLGAP